MALTITFTFLSMVLYGVALYFAYRQAKKEFADRLRVTVRQMRRVNKSISRDNEELKQRLEQIEIRMRQEGVALPSAPNIFQRMERRFEDDLGKEVVEVNQEKVRVSPQS